MDPTPEMIRPISSPSLSSLMRDYQKAVLDGREITVPPLYKPLLDKAFEGGIRKNRNFQNEQLGTFPEAKGVMLWNRNGLLYQAREHLKTQSIESVRFLMFDVSGVKQMDEAGAADYNLNRIADVTRVVCEEFSDVLPIVPSRYGGDEFAVGILGELTIEQQEKVQQLQQKLAEGISRLQLPINKEGRAIIAPVGAKFELSNPAEIAESEERGRELFEIYLDRGVILPTEEIQKMLDDIKIKIASGSSYEEEFTKIRKKDFTYPEGIQTLKQKLNYFRGIHEEYASAFEDLEANIESADGESRAKEYIDYMERVVYDQLLNEHVTDFADFYTHFNAQTFDAVIAIEGKFLKEANKLNYLQGDNVKLGIWESIKEHIPESILPKLTIANRAGAFLLGIDFKKLTVEEKNNLIETFKGLEQSNTARADVEIKDKKVHVPLGIAILDQDRDQKGDHPLDTLRKEADDKWHEQFIVQQLIRIEPHIFASIINTDLYKEAPEVVLDKVDDASTIYYKGEYSENYLLYHYFNDSKRGQDRRTVMMDSINVSRYIKPREKDAYHKYLFPENVDLGHDLDQAA